MNTNTDPVRALIGEMTEYLDQQVDPELDVIAKWRDRLESALASAPQPSFDRRFADMLIGILGDVQDELGFTDEEKLCANGSAEIVAAIRELKERASQQPAAGEEIMVNAAHDVFTLPLQPSGLTSGPRFVVHVPGPQQPAAVDEAAAQRLADAAKGDLGWTQPAPGAWQPIETAPKPNVGADGFGVRLLLAVDCGDGTTPSVRRGYWEGTDWYLDCCIGLATSCGYRVTHWQPLPEPPKAGR